MAINPAEVLLLEQRAEATQRSTVSRSRHTVLRTIDHIGCGRHLYGAKVAAAAAARRVEAVSPDSYLTWRRRAAAEQLGRDLRIKIWLQRGRLAHVAERGISRTIGCRYNRGVGMTVNRENTDALGG
jgi:hypothetical protein